MRKGSGVSKGSAAIALNIGRLPETVAARTSVLAPKKTSKQDEIHPDKSYMDAENMSLEKELPVAIHVQVLS